MQATTKRQQTWDLLKQKWDIIVIGGGVTGAGVFRRAVSAGFRTLLVEQADFSSGTSSKSSKLVHGGFRYLRNKQYAVTRESVKQREHLLRESPNLVTPLAFMMPYSAKKRQRGMLSFGVTLYDLMAPKWKHRHLSADKARAAIPELSAPWLEGAYLYYDARLDDCRLVLRLIQEGQAEGGVALNYARVESLLKGQDGKVRGVAVSDCSTQNLGSLEIQARVVVNATGPWTDVLRAQVNAPARIRPLRGSHLIFSRDALPIPYAVTLFHPVDGRAMFAIPWEGTTIIGTTDLDHPYPLNQEPFCTAEEKEYILTAAQALFPKQNLDGGKVISSFAGLRPIVRGDASNPSGESRAHVVMQEQGLVTITGGKLTIFELMAEDTLKAALPMLGQKARPRKPFFEKPGPMEAVNGLQRADLAYLSGRYGKAAGEVVRGASEEELQRVENLPAIWAEIRYNARAGMVEHLDDLLLRRTRLGMLLPLGAQDMLPRVKALCQAELGWDDAHCEMETARYARIYDEAYSPSPKGA